MWFFKKKNCSEFSGIPNEIPLWIQILVTVKLYTGSVHRMLNVKQPENITFHWQVNNLNYIYFKNQKNWDLQKI